MHANADLVARFIREVVGSPGRAGRQLDGRDGLDPAGCGPPGAGGRPRPDRPVDPRPATATRPGRQRDVPRLRHAVRGGALPGPDDQAAPPTANGSRVSSNLCFADPRRANPDVVDAGVVLAAHRRGVPGQEAAFLGAARSLMRVLANPRRYHSLMRSIDRPVLLVHGERDRLVSVAAARAVSAQQPGLGGALPARGRPHPAARGPGPGPRPGHPLARGPRPRAQGELDALAMNTAYLTCPLCEATCGLAVTFDGDTVTSVRGDDDDAFSHGFICPKGASLKALHEDPDRLRTPMVKRDGEWRQATWDEAFAEIDRRLVPLVAEHGPECRRVLPRQPLVPQPRRHPLRAGVLQGRGDAQHLHRRQRRPAAEALLVGLPLR